VDTPEFEKTMEERVEKDAVQSGFENLNKTFTNSYHIVKTDDKKFNVAGKSQLKIQKYKKMKNPQTSNTGMFRKKELAKKINQIQNNHIKQSKKFALEKLKNHAKQKKENTKEYQNFQETVPNIVGTSDEGFGLEEVSPITTIEILPRETLKERVEKSGIINKINQIQNNHIKKSQKFASALDKLKNHAKHTKENAKEDQKFQETDPDEMDTSEFAGYQRSVLRKYGLAELSPFEKTLKERIEENGVIKNIDHIRSRHLKIFKKSALEKLKDNAKKTKENAKRNKYLFYFILPIIACIIMAYDIVGCKNIVIFTIHFLVIPKMIPMMISEVSQIVSVMKRITTWVLRQMQIINGAVGMPNIESIINCYKADREIKYSTEYQPKIQAKALKLKTEYNDYAGVGCEVVVKNGTSKNNENDEAMKMIATRPGIGLLPGLKFI